MKKLSDLKLSWAINCQLDSAHYARTAVIWRDKGDRYMDQELKDEHLNLAIEQQNLARVWARRAQDILGLWD